MTTVSLKHPDRLCAAALLTVLVACSGSDLTSPSTGVLRVSSATSGSAADLDPDGYTAAVDGGPEQLLPLNGSVVFSQMATGSHMVTLSGVATNCTVLGQDPAPVTVAASDTTQAVFQLTCAPTSPPTGSLQVTTATSGNPTDVDPDGYTVTVDGGAGQSLPINGSVTFSSLAPGTHTVALDGVASNCAVSGENPVVDTVTAGMTAHTAVQIACASPVPPPSLTGRIAFVSYRDGNPEIYVMNANGTGVTRLTNNPATDGQPAWSPDGSKLAFVSDRDGNDEIYVMNADGTGVTRLTSNPAVDGQPAWSPNGTKIAFVSNRAGHPEIYVMNATGSGVTRLTKNLPIQCPWLTTDCHRGERAPAWSPDGKNIAFIHRSNIFGTEIDVMHADGSGITKLIGGGLAERLSWSPTGKIAFDAYKYGGFEIYVVKADGSGLTKLTSNTVQDEYPSWSPDGTNLAFESDRAGTDEIYAMNANGSGVTRLTNGGGLDPAWGP